MSGCKKCGMCCRAIVLPFTRDELEHRVQEGITGDPVFILVNWEEISQIEAYQVNGHLTHWGELRGSSFWRCKLLIGNRCSIHKESPRVCKAYPWYDNAPHYDALYSPRCGFQSDVKALFKEARS